MPTFPHAGVDVFYEDAGAGAPVLLLPGWGGRFDDLAGLPDILARTHRVIAADLPGSGRSGPQPRTYTPAYFHDDAVVFLAMLDALGASPAHVIGFSDGGECALLMAAKKPDAVRSLLTWGSAGWFGTDPQLADSFMTLIDDPVPPLAAFAEYMKTTYGEANARVMTQSAGRAFRAIIEAGGDISRSVARDITCPCLLITGERDLMAPPALVKDMAQAIPGGRYLEAKEAGHSIHREQPEWLTKTIQDWLAEV